MSFRDDLFKLIHNRHYTKSEIDDIVEDIDFDFEGVLDEVINSNNRNVSFHIYNQDMYDSQGIDEPAQSVTVSLNGKSSITGSAGGCTIRGVSDGEYQVKMEYESYTDVREVTIDKDHLDFKFYFYKGVSTQ